MRLLWSLVCIALIAKIDAAKILAYIPTPSISHQLPFRPLFQELARRGHAVDVITTDPAFPKGEAPANLTEIDIHDVSYDIINKIKSSMPKGKKGDLVEQMRLAFNFIRQVVDAQLNIADVKNTIHGKKYDLLMLEAFVKPSLALSRVHKVPVIMVSSVGNIFDSDEIIGTPSHPILYPAVFRQRIYNLTLWEKLNELYTHYRIKYMIHKSEIPDNQMLQKHFGKDLPPLSELSNNVDMLFLNTHPIFEGNHPVPPSVIYMWGIHKKPEKELPQDMKQFLDSSKHGVIYMSFGTNTDPATLPPEKIEKFVRVFCQLPYDILWKWNEDELPGRCSNIKIGKWFPQSDLLKHPNIKLFVTQGGLQSTDEAITAGVPLVGIPMMADQWYNVEKYVHFKIGVQLALETLTEKSFKNAVTTVIGDDSYRRNIRRLDALLRDEPTQPLQRAVWWVEHVLRHGGARHLRAPAANISWAQYFEIELVLILLGSFIVILALCLSVLYYVCKSIRRSFFDTKLKKN